MCELLFTSVKWYEGVLADTTARRQLGKEGSFNPTTRIPSCEDQLTAPPMPPPTGTCRPAPVSKNVHFSCCTVKKKQGSSSKEEVRKS